jgi:hypothetical protein
MEVNQGYSISTTFFGVEDYASQPRSAAAGVIVLEARGKVGILNGINHKTIK